MVDPIITGGQRVAINGVFKAAEPEHQCRIVFGSAAEVRLGKMYLLNHMHTMGLLP